MAELIDVVDEETIKSALEANIFFAPRLTSPPVDETGALDLTLLTAALTTWVPVGALANDSWTESLDGDVNDHSIGNARGIVYSSKTNGGVLWSINQIQNAQGVLEQIYATTIDSNGFAVYDANVLAPKKAWFAVFVYDNGDIMCSYLPSGRVVNPSTESIDVSTGEPGARSFDVRGFRGTFSAGAGSYTGEMAKWWSEYSTAGA